MAAEFARLLKTKSRWSDQRLSGYLVRVLGYSRTGSDRTSRGRTGLRAPLDAATVSEKRHRVTQTDRKSFSPVAAARLARRQSLARRTGDLKALTPPALRHQSTRNVGGTAICSANHLNIRVTTGAADCFPHSTDPRTACEQYYLVPVATPYACRETAARKDCFEKSRLRRPLDRSCRLHRELH
jgi:hypothetical protein